jgi:hypothetical protein
MPFGSLWLPVVVSAVAVWFVSAILHMVLKYHNADYKQLPEEESIANAIRKGSPGPGVYPLPYCPDPSKMKDPAVQKRYEEGPVGMLTVIPNGPPAMGKYLSQWLLYCFIVSFVTAYVARNTLSYDTDLMTVFRITAAVAFAGYVLGCIQDSIWKGIPWSNSIRAMIDGTIYAVVTGLVFRLLWPAG